MDYEIEAIGHVRARRAAAIDDYWGGAESRIVLAEGSELRVGELDAIDGTPVVDLKPVMREFLPRGELRQPSWAGELMAHYWEPESARPVEPGGE